VINTTIRRFPRTLDESDPRAHALCGDPAVMRAIVVPIRPGMSVDTTRLAVDTCVIVPPEAAHAACEFDDQPQALTVSRWGRVKRALRAWWIEGLRPTPRKHP
jgi:hypothetical protein